VVLRRPPIESARATSSNLPSASVVRVAVVHDSCLACGLESELFIEGLGEFVVAAGEGFAQSEGVFGLECEAPRCLVELVERDWSFGEFERAVDVATF
jgi:hypothetical protein